MRGDVEMKCAQLALALLSIICSIEAAGQGPAQIGGTVSDPSGAVIPGAQVSVVSPQGKTVAQGATDSRGAFRFPAVATGSYILDVLEPGFREAKQPLKVDGRLQSQIRVTLSVAARDETVKVEGGDSSTQIGAAIAQNQNANSVDRDALDRLPAFDQDYIATLSRFLNPDATGTNGITLVVNGIEANGPGVTASAIKSVKINQNPYTALFARPGRARIEITTEGGTPQFHGSATFLYRDSLFDAQNPFAAVKAGEQRTYYEGSLTGPLSHSKKTTFLLSLERDNDNLEAFVDAVLPTGALKENVPNPTRHSFLSGRVFHDYGQANQFWMGYSYEHETVSNAGVGGTVLPEAGAGTLFFEHEVNVQDTYVISSELLNQMHFLVGHFDNQTHSLSEAPQIAVSGAFTGGGAQADARKTEYHFDGTDLVTYTTGKQEIKFGIDVPDISRRAYDNFTDWTGVYSFADLNAYAANTPFAYQVQSGQGHMPFVEKTVAGIFEDTIRVSSRLELAAGVRYYWQNYFRDIGHNVAPRLSFAYAPTQKGTTVIRGGAGMFFDRTGPSPISDLLHFNGIRLKRFIVADPSFPATASEVTAVPTSVVVLDPRVRLPYTIQYGVGVERQVTAKSTAAANYVGTRGIDLFRSIDANAPPPLDFAARPHPSLGQEREMQSEGYLKSNALELTFRGKPVSFFTGQAQYTLGRTHNNTSGITYFPANSFAPNQDWSRSDNDRRHKFDLLGTFTARDWFEFGTALSIYSGLPVNITTGNDENNDGMALDRPAGVPRNSLHGPGYLDLDLNLSHEFAFARDREKGPTATVSIDSFNVLNHPNDTTYVGVVTSPIFDRGVIALPPRRMQFNLVFKF